MTAASGKVVMVSGGARGIGRAIVQELLAHGWRVSVGARDMAAAQAVFEGHGPDRARAYAFDAEQPQTETDWVAATVRDFGGIDALVHNAGIISRHSVIEADDEEVDRILDVNVKSPLRLTRKAWPHLLAAEEAKVVVIASLAAKRVRAPGASLYSLSKAAVLSLAHGIRHCGEDSNVRCTALCPGFVATDMASGVPRDQWAQLTQPADVARIARTVLELPATASVAEIPISWRVEPQF
ncbi:SDR family NAD(P)-dependent oxidoreductase [Xylophilus sp. GOD-11R]|uniref:SDR family NAD(P)-dependent oxidoreductase n=1 Tax=Xylophilus sp. GOD-11R TaxID=3089814 RepID=UPI00298CFEE0|nr:SDR family NAD(P)-dependent oxidoreductase [Xylophilus sp. GOD-11R]WPB55156.1 SDR family NAD(P)-dependent oxidoreductase [Xylophilus sp. GOD-11R]